jgi:hypothetical protein
MPKSGSLAPLKPTPPPLTQTMKTAPTKPNRILAYLRFSAGAAFFAAAAALAFVAATTNVLTAHDVAAAKPRLPIAKASIQTSVVGMANEYSEKDGSIGNPDIASQEAAAKRAYPADSTPFTAQMASVTNFRRFMATSASNQVSNPGGSKGRSVSAKNKKQPPEPPRFNTWQMLGPSTATFPSILTFSGAAYNTSGRITALALDRASGCSVAFCRLWVGAAGGGVWRTTNALAGTPSWTFLGTPGPSNNGVPSNAIGAITYDPTLNVLYVGTGEPNASADSEAGMGIYKSLDGGDTWNWLPSSYGPQTTFSAGAPNGTYQGNAFFGRAISRIIFDPVNHNTLYVASARAVRGVDSTYGGPTSNPPVPRPPYGLFKSTDGGYHFTYIWDGSATCPGICDGSDVFSSIRGVTDVKLDPGNRNIVYATVFPGSGAGGGVWRSTDAGSTWTQIYASVNPGDNVSRAAFDVALVTGLGTMMYVGEGNDGANTAHVFRAFNVQTGAPAFTDLTAAEVPAGQTAGYCSGQCWYDNYVVIPPEANNIVYVGGSFSYNTYAGATNGRAVIATQFATDPTPANVKWFDFTWDNTNTPGPSCCNPTGINPNGMHPDSHVLVTLPGAPIFFFAGSDGGLVRSVNFPYADISGQCVTRIGVTIFTFADFLLCNQLLMAVPAPLGNMNAGLKTLQFMSVDYNTFNQFEVQGGTQDNGTLRTFGSMTWNQMIYGDGGQSGIDTINPNLRFNTFFGQAHDTNYRAGSPTFWTVASGAIFASPETAFFYPPIIRDPTFAAANTIFEGSRHVWRTQDWAGTQAYQEANCPEFTTSAANVACGDFVPLGNSPIGGSTNTIGDLGGTVYGADRRPTTASRQVEAIARTTSNTNVAWASTAGGRVFISQNVDDPNRLNVIWTRLDQDSGAAPGSPGPASKDPSRVPTGIAIDTNDNFHAWISYSGYNFNTPSQPGHIFSVRWGGAGMSNAVWTDITNNLPDIPYTSIVFDPNTGDLYVSSDFTVFRLKANQQLNQQIWDVAGIGLPIVEVPKLTINPNARVLYAATHGLSAWSLPLY